jgi:hypothetical protein
MANSNPHFPEDHQCEECGENLANVDADSCQRCRDLNGMNGSETNYQHLVDAQAQRQADNGWYY